MLNKLYDAKELIALPETPTHRQYICPACGNTIQVERNVFYGRCKACSLTLIDYNPAPHQLSFHRSNAKYRLNIGGYGSGKTTMCCAEIANHAITVPNGRSLVTAPIIKQIKDAVVPQLLKFLPPWFIETQTATPSFYCKLINGHEIVTYASNDEENLRSLELTSFYIEEASAIDLKIFTQLQSRLRNPAGVTKSPNGEEVHSFIGLVSSNPEFAWYVEHFILLSKKIHASPNVDIADYKSLKNEVTERSFETFLSSTRDNKFLPYGFVQELCVGKSIDWIAKMVDCKLSARQGLIYPMYPRYVVELPDIPDTWYRIAGFDKGWRDETAMLFGAIDPTTGVIFVYDEYYVSHQPMAFHAEEIKKLVKPYRWYNNIQADPTVNNKNERDGRSYAEYFYHLSKIHLEAGDNNIDNGIDRVRDFMYRGKLKFCSNLTNLRKEMISYSYKEGNNTTTKEKPQDKQNHLLDCLRYMIMKLPLDTLDLVGYNNTNIYMQSGSKEVNDSIFAYSKEDFEKSDENIFIGGIE